MNTSVVETEVVLDEQATLLELVKKYEAYLGLSEDKIKEIKIIWMEVLNIEVFTPQDNLYEIGSTSLHAVMVASQIEQSLGYGLELVTFLETPTFTHLIGCLTNNNG